MTFSYMIQFLDKQTLAQASIMGIVEDLVRHPVIQNNNDLG